MKPEKLAESGTESGQQRALFARVAQDLWQLHCQLRTAEDWGDVAERDRCRGIWDHIDRRHLYPLEFLHSIPNGGSRGDTARARAIRGANMKAEGVKAGIPDVFLPFPRSEPDAAGRNYRLRYLGFYIEMKKPGGRPSVEQLAFRDYALSVGYQWKLCDNWEDAYNELIAYLA